MSHPSGHPEFVDNGAGLCWHCGRAKLPEGKGSYLPLDRPSTPLPFPEGTPEEEHERHLVVRGLASPLIKAATALLLALALPTITVKVMPAAKLEGKPWRISTADADSCTAWVSDAAPNVPAVQVEAFTGCQKKLAGVR